MTSEPSHNDPRDTVSPPTSPTFGAAFSTLDAAMLDARRQCIEARAAYQSSAFSTDIRLKGILARDAQGLFHASIPLPLMAREGSTSALWPSGPPDSGLPEGYRIEAGYVSYSDSPVAASLSSDEQVQQALASGFADKIGYLYQALARRPLFKTFYLAVDDAVLLRYVASDSKAEQELKTGLEPPSAILGHLLQLSAPLVSALQNRTLTPLALIHMVAAAGELSSVNTDAFWGPAQRIDAAWKPIASGVRTTRARQEQHTPALSRSFSSLDEAVQHVHGQIGFKGLYRQQSLIVKNPLKDEYAATEPVAAAASLFTPVGLQQLPPAVVLVGLYAQADTLPAQSPLRENWLYENTLRPHDLLAGLDQARRLRPPGAAPLPLFLGTADGALLSYQSRDSELEGVLFPSHGSWQERAERFHQELLDGALTTSQWVRRLAEAGTLRVLLGSRLWNRPGIVSADTWSPFADLPIPELGQAFLSADDAARHAQEITLGGRAQQLGGLIFQRQDQTFVATRPQATQGRQFDASQLYPITETGLPAFPDGHQLHAVYRSNINLREVSRSGSLANLPEDEFRLAHRSITGPEVLATIAGRSTGLQAFYVLMSDLNLIKYMPSDSREEDELVIRLLPRTRSGRSALDEQLDNGELLPSDFIKLLAKAQGLHLVRGDRYWGAPGKLPAQWSPYPITQPALPPAPALGPLFDTLQAAAEHAHQRLAGKSPEQRVSFILKHRRLARYVASEPLKAGTPAFAPASVFGIDAEGNPRLPSDFELAAISYRAALYPTPLPGGDSWQYRNGFTPSDLSAALPYLRADDSQDEALPLYLSTHEGALLKYQSHEAQADDLLLKRQGSAPSLGEQVTLGNLEARYFVHGLARAGTLSVLRTSEIWDREGTVSDSWQPYQHFQRRRLGPLFSRADDAARHAHEQIPNRYDQLHGGLVLQRPDGLFVATEPWPSPTATLDHNLIFPSEVRKAFFPENHSIIGVYHSRLGAADIHLPEDEAELHDNLFPTWDLYQAIEERSSIRYRYFSGSDGSLIRYTASGSAHEQVLFKQLAPAIDRPLERMDNALQRRIGSGKSEDQGVLLTYARDLLQAGELLVLVPSAIWVHKGVVSSLDSTADGFRAGNGRQAANHGHATAFPELSPVHIDAQDALRHALAQVRQQSATLFGFIFKKTGREEYVATTAVPDEGSRFNRYRVFPEHVDLFKMIAQGYDFAGVYVAPARQGPPRLQDDPLYRHFIGARDFAHLIATARGVCPVSQTPGLESSVNLYLSSADGALLQYQVELFPLKDETAEGAIFAGDGIATQDQLESGSLTPLAYLRQVAATGRLQVLHGGTFWSARGPVTATWDPAATAAPVLERYDVGPLFNHPDDAAYHSHQRINRRHDQLLVNAIYQRQDNHSYASLEPFSRDHAVKVTRAIAATSTQELEQERLALTFDDTYVLHGLHTAHATGPAYQGNGRPAVADFFSSTSICFVTQTLERQQIYLSGLYLSAADGALLKYTPRASEAQRQLCDNGTVAQATASSDHQLFELADAAFVQKVAATGNLSVLLGSPQWTRPGPVDSTWKPAASASARLPRAARALAPPLINSFHDLGVGATDVIDPQRALPVLIGPLPLQPRDRIDLYWGTHPDPVATYTHQDTAPVGGHITLKVETRWITSGMTTVRYVLTPFPGGEPEEAEKTIRVKLDIPGAPERSCKTDNGTTVCENEKLELPQILPPGVIEDPEGVSVVVKRYANMAAGDRIRVSWHGRPIQHPALPEPSDEVVIPIDPAIIGDAGNSDSIIVRYEIRDAVDNWSQWSRPAIIEVGIGDPSLQAPVVPRAQGMMLNLDELAGADVQVLVLRYEGMDSLHRVRLVVEREDAEGRQLEPYSQTLPGHDTAPFVSFRVPNPQFLAILQGQARFYYFVEVAEQPTRRSKSLPLRITGQARILKAPRVPVAEQNGNVLDPAFRNVIAHVEPYAFIAAHQQVKLVWLGKTASGAEVPYDQTITLREDEIDKDIQFLIPDDKVSVLGGGSVTLHYEVTTTAADTFTSLALLLPVSAGALDLPRPQVREAFDTVLLPELALRGATIDVRYADMRGSDSVQAYWRGTPGDGTPTIPAQAGSPGGTLAFFTEHTAVSANIGKRVDVGYVVTRGSVLSPAEILPLDVLPIAQEKLPTPFVRQAPDNRILDLNTFATDATVEVGKWPHIQVGQRIWLQVAGTRSNGTPYHFTLWNAEVVTRIADVIDGVLPRADLDSLKDLGGLTLTFKVSFDGSLDEASALVFPRLTLTVRAKVRVPELILDTSPVNLHGQIFLIPCRPQVLPEFGPGTSVKRVASGGVPGYTYSSENPRVAVVDAQGRVTVRSNGSTHIVVRDKAGQFKKYPVNVYGVLLCYDLGIGNSDKTAQRATAKGLRLPDIDELKRIRKLYGSRWPLQPNTEKFTWSMTAKTGSLGLILLVLEMNKPDAPETTHPGLTLDLGLVTLTHHASGLGIGTQLLPCH
ncbi:Ig-like domain-containing protein [Pseudomonas asplenii]|uniref:Ig-like domain-containing protein n=1 Tax=Pseudomonas asplenii TaxID=53407 RepID=UPI0022344624|nr:Ig-like domain-containing protein [Pseudomonas asplenii]UZE30848.1 Ig-like domain-containing protein [Pseudomonas asplenii]